MSDSTASTEPCFTAARIGECAGLSSRWVRDQLEGVIPSGLRTVRGGTVKVYSFPSLPDRVRELIQQRANAGGYEDSVTYLRGVSPQIEQPSPQPALSDIHPADVEKTFRRQRALQPVMERLHDPALSAAELNELGLEAYEREFGHLISTRHLRRLVDRAARRAGANPNWSDPTLHLPEHPRRKPEDEPAARLDESDQGDFNELHAKFGLYRTSADLSIAEKERLWELTIKRYDVLLALGREPALLKKSLVAWLWSKVPSLSTSPGSLRVSLERTFSGWIKSGRDDSFFDDGRCGGKQKAKPWSNEDIEKFCNYAGKQCEGKVSKAARELAKKGMNEGLSEEFILALVTDSMSKSYVDRRLRERARYLTRSFRAYHLGGLHARNERPPLRLDLAGVPSMFAWSSDDATLPVKFWVRGEDGKIQIVRGQFLLHVDFRTLRVMGGVLDWRPQYTAALVRGSLSQPIIEHGIFKWAHWERGLWKKSKLLKGETNSILPEVHEGLSRLGIKICHSNHPRSKPVENVIGRLQDMMSGERGFCGRDERRDCPEHVRRAEMAVRSGADPSEFFQSYDEWAARLVEICGEYNNTWQGGRRLGGLTPDEAFGLFKDVEDPVTKFDPSCAYLVTHDPIPVLVDRMGIRLPFSKGKYSYYNKELGPWKGQKVLAWFDAGDSSHVIVTDMEKRNPFCVEKREDSPMFNPESPVFHAERKAASEFESYYRARFFALKSTQPMPARRTIKDSGLIEAEVIGQEINRARENFIVTRRQTQSHMRQVDRAAGNLGMTVRTSQYENPETAPALTKVKTLLDELREPESAEEL